jgi:putative ABC transport system permease protein
VIPAARLAWLQLRRQKIRLAVAIAGVAFAVVLMSMQLGFQDALFRSAVTIHQRLKADVVLIHPHYTVIVAPSVVARRRLYQARGYPGVASVTPLYADIGRWKNPLTGRGRGVLVLGVDPAEDVLAIPGLSEQRDRIRYPDVVLWDELSRPEFGPVPALFREQGEVITEVGDRQVAVKGLIRLGTSFGVDATLVTSDVNFGRLFPHRPPGLIFAGLIRLEPGADPDAVRDALAAGLPGDVEVLTLPRYMEREVGHWARATPIGYVFSFGVVMGLIVGAIIVYQILFADISDHLAEYATLKAIGYTNRYLAGVVVVEALILAVLGYVPGLAASLWLYDLTRRATMLPMLITPDRALLVLALTIVMCWGSGFVAMRKLRAADPAEIF